MDRFRTVLDIANRQTNLGFGLVALLTAGGEQVFSSAVFMCPCNDLSFPYGMVFLLVPALALLLLGYILNKKTWKLMTGLCRCRASLCRWKKLTAACMVLFQVSTTALVAPSSWVAVALLNGKYYQCAMTGTNVSAYTKHLCGDSSSVALCQQELHRFPCGTASQVPQPDVDSVLLRLGAQSQIAGWSLIAFVMLSSLLLNCVAHCISPFSYLQLKFWKAYAHEESSLMDAMTSQHAKELSNRNVKSFFSQTPPKHIDTPSNKDWEKVSSLYKFSTKEHYYSTLHRYVERFQETSDGLMRMASIKSGEDAENPPPVLGFVDGGSVGP